MAQRSARAFRNRRLVTIPDAGHVAMMEYPETVALAFRELLADTTDSADQGDTGERTRRALRVHPPAPVGEPPPRT
ncbi:hypothetical protein GCM10023238_38500 [Streptomyces heliomycini]